MKKILFLMALFIGAYHSVHAMEDTTRELLDLPEEVKMLILSLLPLKALACCMGANRELHRLSNSCLLAGIKRYVGQAELNMVEPDTFRCSKDPRQSIKYPLLYELFFLAIEDGALSLAQALLDNIDSGSKDFNSAMENHPSCLIHVLRDHPRRNFTLPKPTVEQITSMGLLLIKNGVDVHYKHGEAEKYFAWGECFTALSIAVEKGYYDVVKLLIDEKADVNVVVFVNNQFKTPLLIAARQGHKAIAQLLLEHGALAEYPEDMFALTKPRLTPLEEAATFGHLEIIDLLVPHYVNVDHGRYGALHSAVSHSQYAAVECLLRLGADIESTNAKGRTVLLEATRNGDIEIVQLLLAHGARRDVIDEFGRSALAIARDGTIYARYVDNGEQRQACMRLYSFLNT